MRVTRTPRRARTTLPQGKLQAGAPTRQRNAPAGSQRPRGSSPRATLTVARSDNQNGGMKP